MTPASGDAAPDGRDARAVPPRLIDLSSVLGALVVWIGVGVVICHLDPAQAESNFWTDLGGDVVIVAFGVVGILGMLAVVLLADRHHRANHSIEQSIPAQGSDIDASCAKRARRRSNLFQLGSAVVVGVLIGPIWRLAEAVAASAGCYGTTLYFAGGGIMIMMIMFVCIKCVSFLRRWLPGGNLRKSER